MYDIFLIEKPDTDGLNKAEIMDIMDSLSYNEVYPMSVDNPLGTSTAMGFITTIAADSLDYDLDAVSEYIASIIGDMDKESHDNTYRFASNTGDLTIFISR